MNIVFCWLRSIDFSIIYSYTRIFEITDYLTTDLSTVKKSNTFQLYMYGDCTIVWENELNIAQKTRFKSYGLHAIW